MQSIMSAFKRSSDKKHKRLLQDSLLSSTHSSFTQDENIQPEDSMLTRVDSLKPQQLLHTPSPSRSSRKTGFQRAFDDQALQLLDNTGVIDVPLQSPHLSSSPFAAPSKRDRKVSSSASKPPRKVSANSRLERSVSSISSPAYTPSRLRPHQDAIRSPVTHSIRKHRGLKAAEERALATKLEQPALSTASDNVQVIVRVRPVNDRETFLGGGMCIQQVASNTIKVLNAQDTPHFTFDAVLDMSVQQEGVFAVVGKPIVDNCLTGYNSCIFAYGQTGSGKTHTMLGHLQEAVGGGVGGTDHQDRGLIPRVFQELFAQIEEKRQQQGSGEVTYTCRCSMLEIYNESVYDLLSATGEDLDLHLKPRTEEVYVRGLSWEEVSTVEDTARLLLRGQQNRHTAATNMNRESSRSHSVFTCVVECKTTDEAGLITMLSARVNLVDLAGSENQKTSGAMGEQFKESIKINKSLSTLGLVISRLAHAAKGPAEHVPYRDSRLTWLLKDSLGGNSKTVMIANISPAVANCPETVSTLRFAREAKRVKNQAVVNEDAVGTNLMLKAELQRVKVQLAALHGQAPDLDAALATCLAFDAQPNTAAAQAAQNAQQALVSALRREDAAAKQVERLQFELAALQELLAANQKELQRNQMVMKFRNAEVDRRRANEPVDVSIELHSLRQELKSLHKEVDTLAQGTDHPEVKRFAVENERLLWELEQMRGMADVNEVTRLRSEIDGLRREMLHMANRYESLEASQHGPEQQQQQALLQQPSLPQDPAQALEILELRDQLQDAHDAIKEAHGNSAGLKEQNVQLETQISRLEQLLADAVSELRASKMALSPMTRQVAEATDRREALRHAHQEAAACKHHLQALEQAHAAQLHNGDEQRTECLRLGQQVQGLEVQLGLMEHQARSLNQDKEQLEEELQDKQALLDQAAAAAHQAETQAAHNSQALTERHQQALSELHSQLDVHQMTAQDIQSQLISKDQQLAEVRQQLSQVEAKADSQKQELIQTMEVVETQEHHMAQLRGNIMGQVNEAEAEAEGARAQAEQERQARWAQVQALLSDKVNLDAALRQQQQAALELQEKLTEAQLQHQQAADMQAAVASASQAQVQQLTAEVQQLKVYYDNLHHQLQQAQQLKSAAESQIEAWKAQHAKQAPRVAELLSERQAWIEELQRERAAASAAAAAAETMEQQLWQAEAVAKEQGGELKAVKEREAELEQQVTALTGQHNIHQRIQHHQKVKDENNALRGQLAACRDDVAKHSIRLERALEELGGYRKAAGRSTTPDFNEEDRLRADLHNSEAQKRQLGQDSQALANLVLDLAHRQSTHLATSPDDRSSLTALQLVKSAMSTMNGVSLELSNMKRNIDDKDQQIKMLQELNKILQLQASMQAVETS
ncbi:TPA: hypothetical protein ACH3X2_002987 [Trebouxia sp. C0005]